MKKRVLAILLTTIVLIGSGNGLKYAYAANTSDEPFRFVVADNKGTFGKVNPRDKQNSTKVYVKVDSSPDLYTQVRTYGDRNTGKFYNETKSGTAVLRRGVPSSITNYCYEHRKANCSYVLVQIGLRSNSASKGGVQGVWSPDSTRNYTVVN